MKTVVGYYKSVAEANKVKAALAGEGFADEHITVIDQSGEQYGTGANYTGHDRDTNVDTNSIGGKIKHFFSGLTGGEDDTAQAPYTQGISNGGALLAVTVPDERADATAEMLEQHGATEVEDGSSAGYGSGAGSYAATSALGASGRGTGTMGNEDLPVSGGNNNYGTGEGTLSGAGSGVTGSMLEGNRGGDYNTANATGEEVIPIVQEDLVVGKRQVDRGGVRVYSHVESRPVTENITLRDERIVVDRRPVDREATDADFNTGAGVLEIAATGEEAVVGKRSRVVEEVLVGKQSSEHTEQINDSVRRTEVDVEPTGSRTDVNATDRDVTTTKNSY